MPGLSPELPLDSICGEVMLGGALLGAIGSNGGCIALPGGAEFAPAGVAGIWARTVCAATAATAAVATPNIVVIFFMKTSLRHDANTCANASFMP
jgi:hypothetical protein